MVQDETYFRGQAARCRRLAADIGDPDVSQHLKDMAREYDRQADDAAADVTLGAGASKD